MPRYDSELIIIKDFQLLQMNETTLFPFNIRNIFLYFSIHSKKKWKQWIDSSGKNEPPPDFFNPKKKIMMDVMRIDDHARENEKGQIINYNNQRIKKITEKMISVNKSIEEVDKKGNLFIIPRTGLDSEVDHNYELYVKNFKRVIKKHILKIDNYKKNHPGYKTVFFIHDESLCYCECLEKDKIHQKNISFLCKVHCWWRDYNLMSVVQQSPIDYIVWVTPYKFFMNDDSKASIIPRAVIIDVKKIKHKKMIKYDNNKMKCTE